MESVKEAAVTSGPQERTLRTYAWLRSQSAGNDVAEDESATGGKVPISDLELIRCENWAMVGYKLQLGSSYCVLNCELNVVAPLADFF